MKYQILKASALEHVQKKVVINEIIFIFKSQERTYFIKETDDTIVLVKAKKNYTDWPISNASQHKNQVNRILINLKLDFKYPQLGVVHS